MRFRQFLCFALLLGMAAHVSAGVFFGRNKKKPPPSERVPELIGVIQSDGDESKRAEAAEELRQYDPAAFPSIEPVLIDALLKDRKAGVRSEAAQSLSKLRPVSQDAGQALEKALHNDPSMRVRLQVRRALLEYHWAGYRSGSGTPPLEGTAKEPPAATGTAGRLVPQPVPSPNTGQTVPARYPTAFKPTTQEPPLAPPPAEKPPVQQTGPQLPPPDAEPVATAPPNAPETEAPVATTPRPAPVTPASPPPIGAPATPVSAPAPSNPQPAPPPARLPAAPAGSATPVPIADGPALGSDR